MQHKAPIQTGHRTVVQLHDDEGSPLPMATGSPPSLYCCELACRQHSTLLAGEVIQTVRRHPTIISSEITAALLHHPWSLCSETPYSTHHCIKVVFSRAQGLQGLACQRAGKNKLIILAIHSHACCFNTIALVLVAEYVLNHKFANALGQDWDEARSHRA